MSKCLKLCTSFAARSCWEGRHGEEVPGVCPCEVCHGGQVEVVTSCMPPGAADAMVLAPLMPPPARRA